MNRREQTFTSPRAKEVVGVIDSFMKKRGRATSVEIRDHVGLSSSQASSYLGQMAALGMVYCAARGERSQGHSGPATWAYGAAPAGYEIDTGSAKRRVVIRTQWEPNHVRMALDCYLFGMPAIGAVA